MAEMKIDIKDVVEGAIEKLKAEGYTVQKWIPCSERLPEKERFVLISGRGTDIVVQQDGETVFDAIERSSREGKPWVTTGFYGSDGWYGADGFPQIVTPSHWMPLPEPPEKE